MRHGTRPQPIFRSADHPCPNRIPFNVSSNDPQVRVEIYRTREETILPEAPGAMVLAVEILGVTESNPVQAFPQTLLVLGNEQQMKVIRHEAVSPDFYSGSWNPIVKAVLEMLPVLVIKEDVAPIGSPLSNMVRATRNCDTRNSWHGESMPDPTCLVKENMVVVPLFLLKYWA
jgi:hypothetical protein